MDILDKIYIRIFEDDIKAINKELGNMPAFYKSKELTWKIKFVWTSWKLSD